MKKRIGLWFAIMAFLVASAPEFVSAQISLGGGTYTQNFDTLASAGKPIWTNNSTLTGWYASQSIRTLSTYVTGTGSSGIGALYSFGAGASTERALGSLASDGPGNLAYGIRFTNDTGATVNTITFSFSGEQWKDNANATAQSLQFGYRISGSAITSSDAGNSNTWTTNSALDFTGPIHSGSTVTLNGNAAANRTPISVTLTGLSIAAGQEVFFRFFDTNDAGTDHALAIDNVAITANPAFRWDATGTNGTAAAGGMGTWDTTAKRFNADNTAGYNYYTAWNNSMLDGKAVFAGTAGTVTLGTGISANQLQFDVGGYTIQSNTLTLVGTAPKITVISAGQSATISSIIAGSNGLTKAGAGTLVLKGVNSYAGDTNINDGTLQVGMAGIGSIASNTFVNSGGTLAGTGTISGAVTNNGGTVAPGDSPGTLHVSSFIQDSAGTLLIDIAGLSMFSVLSVSGLATLDGILNPMLSGGYVPNDGDSFAFLLYGSRMGEFSTIVGTPFAGGHWEIAYTASAGDGLGMATLIAQMNGPSGVPDQGSTLGLFGLSLLGLVICHRQLIRKRA